MKAKEIQAKVNEISNRTDEIIRYISKKWYRIMSDTGLHLAQGKRNGKSVWMVKKGTESVFIDKSLERCADCIVEKWVNDKIDVIVEKAVRVTKRNCEQIKKSKSKK